MNGPDILDSLRAELKLATQSYDPPQPEALPISPWLAMSLLQKAIRRGNTPFALRAAAVLLSKYPDQFWRRCTVIAFEDIGVADHTAVGIVTAASGSKKRRAGIGSDWFIGSYIVARMAEAAKCRAADDLIMIAERHPAYEQTRLDLTFQPISELMRIALDNASLPERAIALWFAIGTQRCPSEHLRSRQGSPGAVFDAICETNLPHTVVEIAREGFRTTGELHCALLPLLLSEGQCEPRPIVDDEFPPEIMCGPVPSWALDMFSREGRRALKLFLGVNCPTTRWMHAHIPSSQRVEFLGYILFSVDSGLLTRRLRWPLADELRRLAEIESQGPYCPDATEIAALLRDDLPLLNEVRANV